MNGRGIIIRAAGVVLFVLLGAATGEIFLRVINVVRPLSAFSNDDMRFRGKPGAEVYGFRLNSRGFLDREYAQVKPDGVFRIAAIGDSFAFGIVPYKDNFLTIFEERLDSGVERFEVLNMGIPAIGPPEYLRVLQDEALLFQPDMVLVFFYIGNDIYIVRDGPDGTHRSYLYIYLARAARILKSVNVFSVLWKDEYSDGAITKGMMEYRDRITRQSAKFLSDSNGVPILVGDKEYERLLQFNTDPIFRMKEICDAGGIEMAVVLLPEDAQVSDQIRPYLTEYYRGGSHAPQGAGRVDFQTPNRVLKSLFALRGIRTIDLYEGFRQMHHSTGAVLYAPYDDHWNVEGNRLAASLLYESGVAGEGARPNK